MCVLGISETDRRFRYVGAALGVGTIIAIGRIAFAFFYMCKYACQYPCQSSEEAKALTKARLKYHLVTAAKEFLPIAGLVFCILDYKHSDPWAEAVVEAAQNASSSQSVDGGAGGVGGEGTATPPLVGSSGGVGGDGDSGDVEAEVGGEDAAAPAAADAAGAAGAGTLAEEPALRSGSAAAVTSALRATPPPVGGGGGGGGEGAAASAAAADAGTPVERLALCSGPAPGSAAAVHPPVDGDGSGDGSFDDRAGAEGIGGGRGAEETVDVRHYADAIMPLDPVAIRAGNIARGEDLNHVLEDCPGFRQQCNPEEVFDGLIQRAADAKKRETYNDYLQMILDKKNRAYWAYFAAMEKDLMALTVANIIGTDGNFKGGAIGKRGRFWLMSIEHAVRIVTSRRGVPANVLIVTVNSPIPVDEKTGRGVAFAIPDSSNKSVLAPYGRDEEINANRYTIGQRVFLTQLVAAATAMYRYLQLDPANIVYVHCTQGVNRSFLALVAAWAAMKPGRAGLNFFDAVMCDMCTFRDKNGCDRDGYDRDLAGFFGGRSVRAHGPNYDLVQRNFVALVRAVRGEAPLPDELAITANQLREALLLAGGGEGGGGGSGGEGAAAAGIVVGEPLVTPLPVGGGGGGGEGGGGGGGDPLGDDGF